MVVALLCKLIAYTPTLLAVVWEVMCYIWTYIIWRTPTSYPGGMANIFFAFILCHGHISFPSHVKCIVQVHERKLFCGEGNGPALQA